MDTKTKLENAGIEPDPLKDQFFLINEKIINEIVSLAELKDNDVVLEIGAGIGNLTKALAKKAGKIIAFEIDERFKNILSKLPKNVEVHIEDAHEYAKGGGKFKKKKEYNKIVANIPYSIGEWLLHNLAFVEYDKVILLVSSKFAKTLKAHPIFASFYNIEEKTQVSKKDFFPVPRTNSVVIDLIKLPDPAGARDLALFLRQYIYQQEEWKVKNSLREGLITYSHIVFQKQLTKKQAKEIINNTGISETLLEKAPDNPEIYETISKNFDEKLLRSIIKPNHVK